jgi:hypothetical protein
VLADYGHRAEELRLRPLPDEASRQLAEFVLPAGALDEATKQGLVQEAALETLTPERMRELNERVAAAYERLYADSLDARVKTLAYHYYRSNDQRSTLKYLEKVADLALARGDPAGAIDLQR